jgi:Na+-translocating ferredoxin:NAD+ oxidoreductase RnfG subunit
MIPWRKGWLDRLSPFSSQHGIGMGATFTCRKLMLFAVSARSLTRWKYTVALLATACLHSVSPGRVEAQTFLTLDKAPKEVFPEAETFEQRKIPSTPQLRKEALKLIGRTPSIWEPFYYVFVAKQGKDSIGYAIVCEEIGRDRPITFITAVNLNGSIKDVAVMMYRETRGREVHYAAFTNQFKGKSLQDPIQGQGDIRNITGATLSVRAMATGVRKAVAIVKLTMLKES